MAEVLLSTALTKLTQFSVELSVLGINKAVEKALSLYGIRGEVQKLERELKFIQATIKDADQKCIQDHRQMEWLKMVMDIAYDIEDAIDIFLLECPKQLPGPSIIDRFIRPLKRMRIEKIPFLCKFQEDIKRIQGKIREVDEYKTRYGIKDLGEKIENEGQARTLKLDPIADPEIVGFAEDIENVISYLLDESYKNLAVVSIVGIGGLGKTTLASKIYKSDRVTNCFANPIWITISQKYDLLDILREIAEKLEIASTNKNDLANKIHESLCGERYLIILDDVWTEELWTQIKEVLPDMKNGSRILITTRIEAVAKSADTKYEPYKLSCLDETQSLELLLKKAIPKNCSCPNQNDDLYKLAKKFATKCKGLPLALIVLGGLLCKKPFDFHTWDKLYKNVNWGRDGSECKKIIAISYEHLPLAKKLCFLYFAAFPEDTEIDAKPLLRMWVAENLISHEGGKKILEETADDFLEDLVQRYHSYCFGK